MCVRSALVRSALAAQATQRRIGPLEFAQQVGAGAVREQWPKPWLRAARPAASASRAPSQRGRPLFFSAFRACVCKAAHPGNERLPIRLARHAAPR
jgi:hypothetical protein